MEKKKYISNIAGECPVCGSHNLSWGDFENTGEYILCGNIKIEQIDNEITIFSESLKWNEQSQRLYGQKNEKVTLTKKNLTVEGTGFCASAADNQFSFSGNVHGTLITGEEKEQ